MTHLPPQTDTPEVSVVLSVYNDVDRVSSAVDSIRAQTLTEWELIAIDDGSSDGCGAILDKLAAADGRIRVIHQENFGLTRALIRGCEEARGEFIARQDADDVSHPDRLGRQATLLANESGIGFVSCWTQCIGPEAEPLEVVKRPADSELATRQLLNERLGPPAHGSVMFRRTLFEEVGGYRAEFYFGQDSDLWLRMAERARIGYVPEVLYQCRRDPKSISGSCRPLQKRFGELGQSCRAVRRMGAAEEPHLAVAAALTERILHDRANGGLFRDNAAVEMAYLIGSRLAQDGDRRAAKYLWRAIRGRPWSWQAWVRLMQAGVGGGKGRDV